VEWEADILDESKGSDSLRMVLFTLKNQDGVSPRSSKWPHVAGSYSKFERH
jgi:hypothetical protein